MYRNDAKTVSIVALAVFHPNTKVQSAAIHFFLGSETDDNEEESSDEDDAIREARRDTKSMQHKLNIGKSTRKRENMLLAKKKETAKRRRTKASGLGVTPNFPALELLHDPQTFGEKLYDMLHRYGESDLLL